MDTLTNKLEQYRNIIKEILTEYSGYKPSHGEIDVHTIFDADKDSYLVIAIGWDGKQRVYGSSIHLDIIDGKVWIQLNNTELDIGQELVDKGIPKEEIVLGLQPPYVRQYTGYAIA
jgi:hypothetical protein